MRAFPAVNLGRLSRIEILKEKTIKKNWDHLQKSWSDPKDSAAYAEATSCQEGSSKILSNIYALKVLQKEHQVKAQYLLSLTFQAIKSKKSKIPKLNHLW